VKKTKLIPEEKGNCGLLGDGIRDKKSWSKQSGGVGEIGLGTEKPRRFLAPVLKGAKKDKWGGGSGGEGRS